MGLFDKIADVSVSKSGQYFKAPGNYRIRIKAVKKVKSQSGANKEFFVIETEVLESDHLEIKKGGERSQVIDMSNVMALPNIKAFVAAASGVDPHSDGINEEIEAYWKEWCLEQKIVEPDEEVGLPRICELIVDNENPLENVELDLECVEITTKKERDAAKAATRESKPDFTKHNWQPREL